MPVRAVPGLTGKQWRRHPVIMPRAARFNQNAGMAGPGFPVPLTAWNRMGVDLCPDTQAGRGPSCSVLLTSSCLRAFDLAPAGLRAGVVGDGDLGLPDGQQGGIDLVWVKGRWAHQAGHDRVPRMNMERPSA
jgi:hypothetical protein